ncbi:hypothetical protein Tco_0608223 [Tanacetum coccineum]
MEKDKETIELQRLIEVISDKEEVVIDAIPLATKPPSIVDYKIHKEGKKTYYKIIRADGSSKMYLVFSHMLKSFDREDLETLWKLVKAKHGSTRPEEGYERVLWGDLKTMFDLHVEDQVWRNQSDYRVLDWKAWIRREDVTKMILFATYYVWWHDMEQDVEDFIALKKFQQFRRRPPEKGVGLRVADSYTVDIPQVFVGFHDPILFLAGLKLSWEHGQLTVPLTIVAGGKGFDLSCFFSSFPFSLIYDLLSLSAKMAFRNFIYTEDDDDLAFLPKEPSLGFGIGSPSASVNTEPPKDVEEPEVQLAEVNADSGESPKVGVFVVHPESVVACIKERKCKTRGGSSRPLVKRKLASRSSSSRAVRAKTSASKDDSLFLSISDDDEGLPDCFELRDANACHLKIFTITPLAWKGHLDNQIDLELLDLHDRCYARQAVVDNAVNKRACEFLQVIEKMECVEA